MQRDSRGQGTAPLEGQLGHLRTVVKVALAASSPPGDKCGVLKWGHQEGLMAAWCVCDVCEAALVRLRCPSVRERIRLCSQVGSNLGSECPCGTLSLMLGRSQ